ncbi:MAG: hypothetical protein ABFD75_03505 [Smithella sp.]
MTIRHPSNVRNILASGIDSLVISGSIVWEDNSFFVFLDEHKEKAKLNSSDYPVNIKHFNPEEVCPVLIKPHGTKGFSFILIGKDFTFKIANSITPNSRPNVMIESRSEALWRLGAENVLKLAQDIIKANGGRIIEMKLSRVDLCLDFLMPENCWSPNLMDYAVTRATDNCTYRRNRKLTGIRFGKKATSARLYDKPLEIEQQSKKYWMYDIWGIAEVPKGKKIIRIEFQLRRETLKDLCLRTPEDLFLKINEAWAYCTKKWLIFKDRPGCHTITQRKTFGWYEEIQDGFQGAQGAEPLVREKAVGTDKKRLIQQANGLIVAIHAIEQEEKREDRDKPINMEDCLCSYNDELKRNPPDPLELQEKIKRKRSKYHREKPPIEEGKVYVLRRNEK